VMTIKTASARRRFTSTLYTELRASSTIGDENRRSHNLAPFVRLFKDLLKNQ
jgi:hypothetical protein